MTPRRLTLTALSGLPLVQPGDDLATLILKSLSDAGEQLVAGDVLVLAQKIVSKSEGRYVDLREVVPSERAVALAAEVDKDPRFVEAILAESSEVVRHRPGVLIVAHRLGFVMANAGVDHSNVEQVGSDELILLLPSDPDGSAQLLAERLGELAGVTPAIIINDSHGRAWRNGTAGVAIGVFGIEPLADLRGEPDLFGRPLQVTTVGVADEIAAAASLLMGQAGEGTPVVLVRGLEYPAGSTGAGALVRPKEQDLFR